MSTVSAAGLPTDLGTCQSPPAGLLCSGRQDRNVVVSLVLLQFMVRRKPAGKSWLSRQPPHERLVKRKARGKRQGPFKLWRKPIETRLNGQDCPCSSGKAPFSFGPSTARFLFGKTKRKWGVESVPRPRGDEIPPAGTSREKKGGWEHSIPWVFHVKQIPTSRPTPGGSGHPAGRSGRLRRSK